METEETLKNEANASSEVIELLKSINKRLDGYDAQFEAIRQGLVDNSVAFDRLQANVINLRADVKELTEEIRHGRKVLV